MTWSLAGRSAIVTGASQGLGLEIARAYVRAGASVMLCARDERKLAEARVDVAALTGNGQRVEAMAADVSIDGDVRRLVRHALEAFGRVHVLVNNAGVYGPFGPVDQIDWTEWERAIAININGSVLPCRYVVPHFKAHRYGKI